MPSPSSLGIRGFRGNLEKYYVHPPPPDPVFVLIFQFYTRSSSNTSFDVGLPPENVAMAHSETESVASRLESLVAYEERVGRGDRW